MRSVKLIEAPIHQPRNSEPPSDETRPGKVSRGIGPAFGVVVSGAGRTVLPYGRNYRMGEALFQRDEAFTKIVVDLDAGLTKLGHASIVDQLFANNVTKTTPCDDVRFTHPALMMIEIAVAQRLMTGGVVPEVAFAVSLGEYAASAVAGVLPAVEFLDCIARSAQVIEVVPENWTVS